MLLSASAFFLPWGGGGGRGKVYPPHPPRSHQEEHKQDGRSQLPFLPLPRVGRPPSPPPGWVSPQLFSHVWLPSTLSSISRDAHPAPPVEYGHPSTMLLLSLPSQGSQMRPQPPASELGFHASLARHHTWLVTDFGENFLFLLGLSPSKANSGACGEQGIPRLFLSQASLVTQP